MSARDVIDLVLASRGYDRTEGTADAILAALGAAGYAVVLTELLRELADDLENEIVARGDGDRRRKRDMEPVVRARAVLAAADGDAP